MSQHVEVVRGFTGRMDWPAFVESDNEETGEGDADVHQQLYATAQRDAAQDVEHLRRDLRRARAMMAQREAAQDEATHQQLVERHAAHATALRDAAQDEAAHQELVEHIRRAHAMIALTMPAEFFSSGPDGSVAWKHVKAAARKQHGVELSLNPSGVVKARCLGTYTNRRKYVGDDTKYTFAETLEFVLSKGGSFRNAVQMWTEEMR